VNPSLFAALYRGKSLEKVAQAHGVGNPEALSSEKVALWNRLKNEAGSDPLGVAAGVARLAHKFAQMCVRNGEKLSADRDVGGQCISIGTAVCVDEMITKMAEAGTLSIEKAAEMRIMNAECAMYELGLLTEAR